MNKSTIPVMEIFGPTIQGEGMIIGQKTMFVRTAGCDYSCSWCDSAFTWDGTGKNLIKQMNPVEIWEKLVELGGDGFSFVTISGGNPALIRALEGLMNLLKEKGIKIGLETQGSKWQDWFLKVDEITISPKPPSSGMVTDFGMLDCILEKLSAHSNSTHFSLKIVVFDEEDFRFAKDVHFRYPHVPFFLQVGNSDSQTTNQTQLVESLLKKYEWLIATVMADHELKELRVLPQLHTFIWGNKRGV